MQNLLEHRSQSTSPDPEQCPVQGLESGVLSLQKRSLEIEAVSCVQAPKRPVPAQKRREETGRRYLHDILRNKHQHRAKKTKECTAMEGRGKIK